MCLAIPGKILTEDDWGFARSAPVQVGGIVRQVRLNFVPA
jgi:hydrogenase maturation factor